MKPNKITHILSFVISTIFLSSCVPELVVWDSKQDIPKQFIDKNDTTNTSSSKWDQYFNDPDLVRLIEMALLNNQELNIFQREMEIMKNEVLVRKGEYLPFINIGVEGSIDKVGEYSRTGAVEKNLPIKEDKAFPEPLSDFILGIYTTWEVDIWKKLRNAKKSALTRYLATVEGRNFLVTNLVSEIAVAYYELLALDRQLDIVQQNVKIQSDALEIVKIQKQAARVTELAVKRFEAQLTGTQSLQYDIQQSIVEKENEINFLIGRFPQPIARSKTAFDEILLDNIHPGVPLQLLENRPDIRQAELELAASKIDVKVAKANFYPRLDIGANLGYQAFNPKFLISTPESMLFRLGGELVAPLVNRNRIKAIYRNANERQIQATIEYQQTILKAYIEVVNQLANIQNLKKGYEFKSKQVQQLNESINISNNLFKSTRADYIEVLLTQEEALESRFELVETKVKQLNAKVNIYRVLGGGWR